MHTEGRVVVLAQPRFRQNTVTNLYAADIRELGLVATGATPEEALQRLVQMFAGAVASRRKVGRLVAWLDDSGLEWHWEDDMLNPKRGALASIGREPQAGGWSDFRMIA